MKTVYKCTQRPSDGNPVVGALQEWIPPEDRETLAQYVTSRHIDHDGWITHSPLCQKHLLEHKRSMLAEGVLEEHIRQISLEKYVLIMEAENGGKEKK